MRNAFALFMFGRVAQKQALEGALRKKVFLKFSLNAQENICPRVVKLLRTPILNNCERQLLVAGWRTT